MFGFGSSSKRSEQQESKGWVAGLGEVASHAASDVATVAGDLGKAASSAAHEANDALKKAGEVIYDAPGSVGISVTGIYHAPGSAGISTKGLAISAAKESLKAALSRRADLQETQPWATREESEHPSTRKLEMVKDFIDNLAERMEDNEKEEKDPGLIKARERDLDPASWPTESVDAHEWENAPCGRACLGRTLRWLRARALYSMQPADRDWTYRWKHARWMLVLPALLVLPGVAGAAWLLYLATILFVDDPFSLLNAACRFKVWALIYWGLAPILYDHIFFYFLLTNPAAGAGSCAVEAEQLLLNHQLPPLLASLDLACFYLSNLLCFGLYLRHKLVLYDRLPEEQRGRTMRWLVELFPSLHERFARLSPRAPLDTHEKGAATWEVTLLMRYDLAAVLGSALVQQLFLVFGILGLRGFDALLGCLDFLAMGATVTNTIPADRLPAVLHHRGYAVNALALLGAPFLLFKLPVVGEMIHMLRVTGFDLQGDVRLAMMPAAMQVKWCEELKLMSEAEPLLADKTYRPPELR